MIFYFSATGNSKYVASRVKYDNEELVFIPEAVGKNQYVFETADDTVGLIFPTYDWALPSIVTQFLEKLTLKTSGKPYVYYVGTFGTTTGAAAALTEKLLKKRGIRLNAKFDIRMPDTWTPMYDLSDAEKVAQINRKADEEIEELISQIRSRVTGRHMDLTMPVFTGRIGQCIYDSITRRTSGFSLSDSCIGCGLCARKCPVQAIEMQNNRPVWVKDRCVMCLGCLHRCPKFAIQYGKHTPEHGQYTNPHVQVKDPGPVG